VAAAVLISLFVSFTLDPMLSSVWYDPDAHGRRSGGPVGWLLGGFDRVMQWTTALYRGLLAWSLRHRLIVLIGTVAIFFGSFFLLRLIGVEFVPPADLGEMVVEVQTPVGSSIDYTSDKARQVDAALREFPEVAYTYATVNSGVANDKNIASIYVRLTAIEKRTRTPDTLAGPVRERLGRIAGISVSVGTPGIGGAAQKPIQVSVKGTDIAELDRLSGLVMTTMRATEGVVDVDSSLKAAKPTLDVRVDRGVAGDLGLDVGKIYQALRPLIAGEKVSLWKAPDGENYDVIVRLSERDRATTADLHRITVASSQAGQDGTPRMVPLNAVARIEPGQGASQINRRDLAREALLAANVAGRPAGDVGRELTRTLGTIKLPPGYQIVFGGSTKDLAETSGYAATALILGVIFIYIVLASQFGSFLQPLAIMASLPLSLVGVFLGLLVAGTTLNIFSAIGFLTLMGLVTKNAILLVDFANQAQKKGQSLNHALLEAGTVRLRPILMTTLAMIFGMLPLALAMGEGAGQRAPMAHAVIGGLISSTLLTLVVVPVLLTYLDSLGRWVTARFAASAPVAAVAAE
jgi:HAE1 family hydrophobic/amphiphilic exporter-1